MPFPISSSATYCTIDFRAIGSISFGCDLVAGRSLVPCPATGTIALRITVIEYIERRREAALAGIELMDYHADSYARVQGRSKAAGEVWISRRGIEIA